MYHFQVVRLTLLVFFLMFLAGSIQAVNDSSYISEMEKYRGRFVQSLWQSEREPIQIDDTVYLDFFPISKKYKLPCKFIQEDEPKPFEMATYSGQIQHYIKYGTIELVLDDIPFSLELYQNYEAIRSGAFADYLFLPFKDATNAETTYGGGRYLNMSISDIRREGCYVDFNLAYNPWCAYRMGFNCPIPPRANHLEFPIKAGEKTFRKPE
ncbi:MAG: DUF1684 domain-containing protein [Saprospirales bacterium]|nr:MAG: DUF1684 domain-containing protein [Saprospirales bacterium]